MKIYLLVILLQLWATTLLCCDCKEPGTVKQSIESSNIVVSGTVISIALTANLNNYIVIQGDTSDNKYKRLKYPSKVVKLKVTTLFKGQITSDTLTIITPSSGAGCGANFELGKQYIIYGTNEDHINYSTNFKCKAKDNNVYWTHLCTRTTSWSKDEETEILSFTKK
jgi:hypothetical protein